MPSDIARTEARPGLLSRCWAVVYDALVGAATCLVCGMGLLKYIEESDRRTRESEAPAQILISSEIPTSAQILIPAQRRGSAWERIPPGRG